MMNLKDLKSAEVIDDPSKIADLLEASAKNGRSKNHTSFVRSDDGHKIVKHSVIRADDEEYVDFEALNGESAKSAAKKRGIEWKDGYGERIIPYKASDERVDSHGDIVRQSWLFDRYSDNPVIGLHHEWGDDPVGASLREQVLNVKSKDYKGLALHLDVLFPDAEVSDRADGVFRLVRSGFMKSGSVGFYPDKIIDVKDDKEREELGLGKYGYILEDNHLLEFSPVFIPANVGAHTLSAMKRKGQLVEGDMNLIREILRISIAEPDTWLEEEKKYVTVARSLFSSTKWTVHKDKEEPILPVPVKSVIRFRKGEEDSLTSLQEQVLLLQDMVMSSNQMISDCRDILESLGSKGLHPDEKSLHNQVIKRLVSKIANHGDI